MFRAAFEATKLEDHRYQHLPIPPHLFEETVKALPGAGFSGVNVTIPHKEAALAASDIATQTAREIGAANTLTFTEDGTIDADNTDAPGFIAALGAVPGTALVLGAGGSARAVVWALRRAGAEVSVLARTPERARGWDATVVDDVVEAECLVNCTPLGMKPGEEVEVDPSGFEVVVDLVYRDGPTALIERAERAGARTVDGLEILVRQGALSFQRWTGIDPPLDAMRRGAGAVH
jgi:shikimate dehydrogenase